MDINYNIISLIETLGFVQGVILGLILLIISYKKQKTTIFLSLFILAFSFHFVPIILEDLHIIKNYPILTLPPFNATWIALPLFFIYIHKISIFSQEKTPYWVLYPGLLVYIFQLVVFLLPVETKLEIKNSPFTNMFFILGLLYVISLAIYTINYIRRHNKEVKNQYSSMEHKDLRWANFFLICLIVPALLVLRSHFIAPTYNFRIVTACIAVSLIYWVTIKGGMQLNIPPILPKRANPSETQASISEEVLQDIVTQTEKFIISSEAYKSKELTIVEIAEELKVHPRRVSTAINKISKKNFNSYINKFRIDEAKKLILELETNNLSVEGIGSEVGFHSKSAFYSAFKKNTNTTPSEYKNQYSKIS
ncbi:MAG: hypothetical protein COA50_06780 [Flavobacteriaceae bacterium]|nr:MAG: hypothetical protein COA50_06780 [Flavobacteriaceae bacterium]